MGNEKRGRGRPPKARETELEDPEEFDASDPEDDSGSDAEEGPAPHGGGGKGSGETAWNPLQGAPEGLETFIRNRKWEGKDFHVRIYELVANPRAPGKEKAMLRQVVHNEYVDDVWLLQNNFRGRFKTWLFYMNGKQEVKMNLGTYEVSPMAGNPNTEAGMLTPSATAAGPGQPGTAGGLNFNLGGQTIGVRDLLLLKELFGPPAGAAPTPGYAYPAAPAPMPGEAAGITFMERITERQLKRADELMQKLEEKLYKVPTAPKPPEEEKKNPPWLDRLAEKYLPKITRHIDKLLGDSEDAKEFREFITGDEVFRGLWADPEKKQKIAGVLVETLQEKGLALFNYLEKEAGTPPAA